MELVISSGLGAPIVIAVVRELVHELFDPSDSGSLSRVVMHGVWRVMRTLARARRSFLYGAGAMVLIGVAVMWTGLLTVGWAPIYWPHLPGSYNLAVGLAPSSASGFATALYVSLASLTTLGANGIEPVPDWLRFATAFESLIGAALIAAWITWVLSIYPVLARRRALTYELAELRRAHPRAEALAGEFPGEVVGDLLRALAEQILRAGTELGQTRVSYYFQNRSEDLTLARQLPYALAVARAVEASSQEPAIRKRGTLLRAAVEANPFLDVDADEPPDRIIDALARDHLLD